MANQTKTIKIDQFSFDDKNANKGTVRGRGALEKSLSELGAGRSILVDKNLKVIAGNKTLEVYGEIGLEDVLIVPSDGSKLIAIQRTDLSLDEDEKARILAFSDNRISEIDLSWSVETLVADIDLLKDTQLWSEKELQLLQDGADLLQFESIAAGEPVAKEEVKTNTATEKAETKDESGLLPFHALLSQQQRERLFEAINQAKSKHGLETTAEALDVIVQEYLA